VLNRKANACSLTVGAKIVWTFYLEKKSMEEGKESITEVGSIISSNHPTTEKAAEMERETEKASII